METIGTIIEIAMIIIVIILCGAVGWLYSLEIIKKIKSFKKKGS